MEGTDSELIALASAGDRGAFSSLVDRHAGPIWSAVSRAISDREAAREVFQETWVRAFERLHTLRQAEKLRSWLLSIALNLTRQGLRRAGPVALDVDELGEASLASADAAGEGGLAESGAEAGELRSALARAVAALPPRQREVVELRVTFERSYAEIAAELGISEENARANYYQGLKRLRAAFADDDAAEGTRTDT